ncbi:MAG: TetR/AcrR family transcriptional regulator [bacterium]|nr:TetR/AcrR family transcriptional regulator [bacterium]
METNKLETPEKIKKRLYPVVLQLFSEKDFHEVNIRDISGESGLSTATIYKYYSSKEDLLFSIIDEKLMELGSLMRLHIAGLESSREIFRKLFWVTMDFFDRNPQLAIAAFITVPLKKFMESKSYRREQEVDILNEVVEKAKLLESVSSDIQNRYFSDLYFMITHRHIHNWYFHGMKWKLSDTITDFFDYFWKMVKPVE